MINRTRYSTVGRTLIAGAVATVLLAACAAAPVAPDGAAAVRARLTQLQADPKLATLAPAAINDADAAVRSAEQPEADRSVAEHRVYVADRKVEIARAQAQARFAEDQRAELTAQRDAARLESRTREVDVARGQVADAQQETVELQREIDALKAKVTERGLVLTLGDVLFANDSSELKAGSTSNLNELVAFLVRYPTRTVMIEGHTDNVGTADANVGLSQRRAESVRSYLVSQGIDAARLSSMGAGESVPVADNESAAGRQQNRRVEVIISNPVLAAS